MSCHLKRKRHWWGKHTGAIKSPYDKCGWCGKFRFMVDAEKKYASSKKQTKRINDE